MTRITEAALIALAAVLAGAGSMLARLAEDEPLTLDALLATAVFLAAFGGLLLAVRLWAGRSTRTLLPLAALLTAVGWTEVARIDPDLGRLQLWWLLVGAAIAAATLFVLRRPQTPAPLPVALPAAAAICWGYGPSR